MVPVLARMAVIIKSEHESSIITGNYEMAYICGLLSKLSHTAVPVYEGPIQLRDRLLAGLEQYTPAGEREAVLLKMLRLYEPDEAWDEQMEELFLMGLSEERLWQR